MTNFPKIEQALKGQIAPSELTDAEQEAYLDRLGESLLESSPAEDKFFADMQLRGEGVGMDDAGNIVYGPNEKSKPL
jgi:hypothetical protein